MNREIKFRLWDLKNKNWTTPSHLEVVGDDGMLEPIGTTEPIKNYVIQQYIGLRDKNGKEIYEGDIIQERYYVDWGDDVGFLYRGVVYWCPTDVGFRTLPVPDLEKAGNTFRRNGETEVVGNIFENQKLLKTPVEPIVETIDDEEVDDDLEKCEQCGENAWDGSICHSCGMKII